MARKKKDKKKFWHEGLQFECQQCGYCCIGFSGIVEVNSDEIRDMAKTLGISPSTFRREYCFTYKKGYSLKETDEKCIFYDQGCKVYHARPNQCRTFPFWSQNLQKERQWVKAAKHCPGIDQGNLYTAEEIQKFLLENH